MDSRNLLYAYSLGCSNKDDADEVLSIINTGATFSYEELGEYQNLSALLPAILNIENPAPEVKDKVARKLYRIQDEIRKKKSSAGQREFIPPAENKMPPPPPPKTTVPPPPVVPEPPQEEDITSVFEQRQEILEEFSQEEIPLPQEFESVEPVKTTNARSTEEDDDLERTVIPNTGTKEFEVVSPKKKEKEFVRPPQETQIRERAGTDSSREKSFESIEKEFTNELKQAETVKEEKKEKYPYGYTRDKKKKGNLGTVIIILLAVIVIAAAALGYLKLSQDIESYKAEIENLKTEVAGLQNKANGNDVLNSLINSKGLFFAELTSADFNSPANSKVILSRERGEVYFRFNGLPELTEGNIYQVWIKNENTFQPVVSFVTEEQPFALTATIDKNIISAQNEIRITEEKDSGAERPGRKIILQGTIR